MFYGDSTHNLDAKFRVFVPKRFQTALGRDEDGNQVAYLTRGLDGCLFLFSEKGFEEALKRMNTQAFAGAEARKMQRLFFSNTHRVQLDSTGRLLIPEKLRTAVGLEKEVAMIGVVSRAEIWPRDRWEAFEQANDAEFALLDQVLCGSDGDQGPGDD